MAYDPDGHLADILLTTHYDEDQSDDLLSLGTLSSLSPSPVAWAPVAWPASKNYELAQKHLTPATPPDWHGGAMRLIVDPATKAFPKTCCYLLRLTARKRTILNCDDDEWTHINRSERSFMIEV